MATDVVLHDGDRKRHQQYSDARENGTGPAGAGATGRAAESILSDLKTGVPA